MPQEIQGPGRPAAAAANLRPSGVKPLRASAPREAKQTLDVAELRKGGDMDLGRLLAGQLEESRSLRERATGRHVPKASARQSRSAGLSLPERLQKLAQIKKSATDYEAIFIDQLVKQMRPSPLAHTPGGDTFSELAEQPFRDFLSQAGGLGLANNMVGQIARQEGLEQTLHEHPEVMGPTWRPTIPRNLGPKTGERLTLAPDGRKDQGSAQASGPSEAPVQPIGPNDILALAPEAGLEDKDSGFKPPEAPVQPIGSNEEEIAGAAPGLQEEDGH